MPRQGQSVESCILTKWLVQPGDAVKTGQPLAGIETDKASFEVESPADGTVLALFFDEGADVPVLTNIGALGAPGEDFSALRPSGEASAAAPATTAEVAVAPAAPPAAAPAAVSVPAPGAPVGVSPRARKLAASQGLPTQGLAGSGPGGRVIERDVQAALAAGPRLSAAARAATGAIPAAGSGPAGMVLAVDRGAAPAAPAAGETVIPVKGVRKIVAERMRQSLAAAAQYTLHRRFDATALQAYRAKIKTSGEALGLANVTVGDLLIFALSRVLPRHPALNAHFLGDKIVQFGAVHIGVAVDTPRGLMVPVLRDAQAHSLREISAEMRALAKSCQEGNIAPDRLAGGTFTLTNLGALGVDYFTPVLNTPQVAILGVGGITHLPVATDGVPGCRFAPTIGLSLTADHQAVDGAPAARFLQDLAQALEHIELTLAH